MHQCRGKNIAKFYQNLILVALKMIDRSFMVYHHKIYSNRTQMEDIGAQLKLGKEEKGKISI